MRKRLSGDDEASSALLGVAKNLLRQLRRSMEFNKLTVGQHSVDLEGGKRITVSSVFGQDEIIIHVPPTEAPALIETAERSATGAAKGFDRFDAKQRDMILLATQVTLTITVYNEVVIIPDLPPGSGTNDVLYLSNEVLLTIITTTQPTPYVPPPEPVQIIIAGYRTRGGSNGFEPFMWDNVNKYRHLGLSSTFGRSESSGKVFAMSPDGTNLIGHVVINLTDRAANWRNGTGNADIIAWVANDGINTQATTINAAKTEVQGRANATAFKWNGRTNGALVPVSTFVPNSNQVLTANSTSPNGRLKIQGNKYQLDNGTWITPAGVGGDCTFTCCTHIPYTPPTPPPRDPIVKTTVLVFSG